MKKILLMLALFSAVVTANAQIATENSNAFDNVGVVLPQEFHLHSILIQDAHSTLIGV